MVFSDSMISIAPLRPFIPSVRPASAYGTAGAGRHFGLLGLFQKSLTACNRAHDNSTEPLHFHVSGLVANSVDHLHPQDIMLAMFYFIGDVNSAKDVLEPGHHIIGIEVDTATVGNDEAVGCLSLD